MSRVITEARAGLNAADVMDDAGLEIEQLKHQGLLASYQLPDRDAFLPGTVDKDGTWAAIFLNSEVIAYNPNTLSSLGLKVPTTWEAFGSKEWRGNFGLPAESYEWWNALRKFFGRDRADAMVRNYAANHPRLTSSHTIAVNDIASGDLPAAVNVYGYYALEQVTAGRSIAFVNPTPTVLEVQGIATLAHAPHPNAARLFARWLLSKDTQQWVRDDLKRITARKDVGNDKRLFDPNTKFVLSNPDDSPAAGDLVKAFNAIFELPT
jgi:iron(III) transport system substrate-binding protein